MPLLSRQFFAILLCWLLTASGEAGALLAQATLPPRLELIIVEGDGAINNIKQRTAREPIVEVQDENHRPVAGVAVLFTLPTSGPGATFAQGARSATFFTNQNGRVVARGLRLNRTTGRFQIQVSASNGGRTATTLITQTNIAAVAGGTTVAAGLSLKLVLIVAAAAAATAGGVYAATHTGGDSSSNSGTGISVGPPTVGAPK